RFDQHFEPEAEPTGIEPVRVARSAAGAPQIDVEDARQLLRCGQRYDFAAVLEPNHTDQPVQDLRIELTYDLRKVGCFEEAGEEMRRPVRVQSFKGHASSESTKVARPSRDVTLYFLIGYMDFLLCVCLTEPYNRSVRKILPSSLSRVFFFHSQFCVSLAT